MAQLRYRATNIHGNSDIEGAISTRLFNNLCWRQYKSLCRDAGVPYYREHQQSLQRDFLAPFHAEALCSVNGAYFPIPQLMDQIHELYEKHNAIGVHPFKESKHLDFVISLDNRPIFGNNEGFHIRPADVVKTQSSLHVHDFAISATTEDNASIRAVAEETDINGFIHSFGSYGLVKYGCPVCLWFSADWMGLVNELDATKPHVANLDAPVCWCCGATRNELVNTWRNDPFAFSEPSCTIDDYPNAALYALPLDCRRYDWMHGATNLLSNTLHDTFDMLPATSTGKKGEYKAICALVHYGWSDNTSLRPVEMKRFFSDGLHHLVPQLYSHSMIDLPWPGNPSNLRLTQSQSVRMLYDSIRVIKEFGYTEWPLPQDFSTLWTARTAFCSVSSAFRLEQKPTGHFMLNEAIYYARKDKRAYHFLQEGADESYHLLS